MAKLDLPRMIFSISSTVAVFLIVFGAGAYAGLNNAPPVKQIRMAWNTMRGALPVDPAYMHMQPSRNQGSGVTLNLRSDDRSLILLNGFFENENQVRLIRRDGTVIRKWSLHYTNHFAGEHKSVCERKSHLHVDVHGIHLSSKGELAANYEYCGSVKLDRCGAPIWTLNEPNHHSITEAETGGYWILSRNTWSAADFPDRLPPFSTPGNPNMIREDTILRVSEAGEIIHRFSIPAAMMKNGLGPLLTANNDNFTPTAFPRDEIVHANQAIELTTHIADQFPQFEAGDLAISLRGLNLVMVLDPDTQEIKWHQTGPWLRQHDAEFRSDGRISVFNNNVFLTGYRNLHHINLETARTSNILAIDPMTGETEILFGERPGQELLSVIRGQHTLLDNDGMLIVETDAGRVIEVDRDGKIVWEYINAHDDNWVGEIMNAYVFDPAYFSEDWNTCPDHISAPN